MLRRAFAARRWRWGCLLVEPFHGLVNAFRLVCEAGCSYNWASAKPLPGRPAAIPSRPEPPSPGSRPLQCVYTSVYALNILSEIRRT